VSSVISTWFASPSFSFLEWDYARRWEEAREQDRRLAAGVDAVIQRAVDEALQDPDTVGLLLDGSRGAGCASERSDYDFDRILGDDAFEQRRQSGQPMWLLTDETGTRPGAAVGPTETLLDITYTCPRKLDESLTDRKRALPLAETRVLADKTGGEIAGLIERARALVLLSDEEAAAAAERALGAYLNRFYRSLKSCARGEELSARLHASESVMHLFGALFALERRVQPHYDRVWCALEPLVGQGWAPGELHGFFLGILRSGDPILQIELESRVERLYRARGLTKELDGWGDILPRVRAPFLGVAPP
jgi:hypothetical protein